MASLKCFGSYCDPNSSPDGKLVYPAAERNKEHILLVLKEYITKYFSMDDELFCLEISSGTGQHVAHFAPNFPKISFQPTEYESHLLKSIDVYAKECPTKNIKTSLLFDASKDLSSIGLDLNSVDVILNSNLMQVSPYECTVGLFTNAGKYLRSHGIMINYGPFAIDGVISPESNVVFDKALRENDPRWGIRDLTELKKLAERNNLSLVDCIDQPANNKCVVWRKN